jgi:hypothetical protein
MARKNRCVAESWIYVTKADRELPKDQQSRFTLSPMTAAERDVAQDTLSSGAAGTREYARKIARDHIVSVENFPVGEPKPWPEKSADREAYLATLHDDDVLAIGNEVWVRSSLGADEEPLKNSSTPERTSASGASSAASSSTTAPSAPSSPP